MAEPALVRALRQRRINKLALYSAGDEALPDWRLHAAWLWPQAKGKGTHRS
jgi:hypothetical protein